mmetsp:Transcript_31786/g.31070  ORF Transcript_31786/g.31070 Transcript_31786/m.31070 type:complete len:100 (-) Transcript_31786:295-594(-)
MEQATRYYHEMESLTGQLLICQQIKDEQIAREREQVTILEGQIKEMKETMERKEYNLQNAERRMHEYEYLLKEIAEYDSYVKMQLNELNVIMMEENEGI